MHVKPFIVLYWHLHHFRNAWTARPKWCWKGEHEGDNCWVPGASCTLHNQIVKFKKHVMFQLRWLELHRWLAYSSCPDYRGGWCLSSLLFPSNNEKEKLVAFVNPVFTNYNKSKEQLDSQAMKEYCKLSIGNSFSHCLFDHNTASLKIKLMFTSSRVLHHTCLSTRMPKLS